MTTKNPFPPDRPTLARAAEMLALPERICRRRDCRRRQRCTWFFRASDEPCCLANLDAEQRRLFDLFAQRVRDARDLGSWPSKVIYASAWRETRELQDAAVETARPLVAQRARRCFRAFEAMRERQPPPDCNGLQPRVPRG